MTQLLTKIIADFSTTLTTKTAVGATTATLTSGLDGDGIQLPTATYGFTIDRNNANKEYFTATLTGANLTSIKTVTRGTGVGTSGLVKTHRKGAEVIISDWVAMKRMLDILDGTTSLDASTPLGYDGTATISTANQLATKDYVDNGILQGAADASTTVKGITKMSVAPASASSPIAVGDNDGRIPTQGENDALVGTSGTPSSSNKYVTNDDTSETAVASKVVRYNSSGSITGVSGFFGNGSDGAVTISGNTSLSRDMYYTNLTINNGITLSPKGFRIFVNGTLTCTGTGKIDSNGANGGAGGNGVSSSAPTAGSAGVVDYSTGSLPLPKAGQIGGTGTSAIGGNGTNGTTATLNLGLAGAAGGTGGAGSFGSGGTAGTAGAIGTSVKSLPNSYNPAYNLYDLAGSTLTRHELSAGSGSGSQGGGDNPTTTVGGAGGGSGSTGGCIFIAAKTIVSLNVNSNGGAGGAGGNGTGSISGGGGGGAGGNGGIIIIISSSSSSVVTSVAAGSGGAGGTANASGTAGTAGSAGVVYQITV